jgi:hypothetical protein
LKGQNIPFVKEMKYLGVILDSRVTWRHHIDSIVTKALRTFIRIYSLLKSKGLSAKSKLTLYRALMRSKKTCLPSLGVCCGQPSVEIAAPAK